MGTGHIEPLDALSWLVPMADSTLGIIITQK